MHLERSIPLIVALALAGVSAPAQDTNAYLYIAHAASGRNLSSTTNPAYPVDVSVNGVCVVKGESFGDILGPFTVPAGTYDVMISSANTVTPCGNAALFSASVPLAAGTAALGILSENASNQPAGQIVAIDLSPVGAGWGRVVVANATGQDLSAMFASQGSGGGSITVPIAAGALGTTLAPQGEYLGLAYLNGSATAAIGPVPATIASRDVYLYVLAGSTANQSVQLIGPKTIKGVF